MMKSGMDMLIDLLTGGMLNKLEVTCLMVDMGVELMRRDSFFL